MDNEFNVIDMAGLKAAIDYHGIGDLQGYLHKEFNGVAIHYPWSAICNPHFPCAIEKRSLIFNRHTGYWIDRSCGDSGPDLVSLVAYLFQLPPNKAALRIIEEMRLSHG